MSELKAGYWKTRDGMVAHVDAKVKYPDADGTWVGSVERWGCGWWNDSGMWDCTNGTAYENSLDLVEYIGPTLPPEPGPGWRLLKKEPEPEPVEKGDEYLDGKWRTAIRAWDDTWSDRTQVVERWYRRRVTPEPPQPPDGWELLPDGTEPQHDYQRNDWFADQRRYRGWVTASGSVNLSGPWANGDYVWYARRIEPQPFEGQVRWFCVGHHCEFTPARQCLGGKWYVQRQFHDGEWRDVGVQQ